MCFLLFFQNIYSLVSSDSEISSKCPFFTIYLLVLNVFILYYVTTKLLILSLGDNGQLHPFKKKTRTMIQMASIFDLHLSKSMQSFTIYGENRCNNSYQIFLGNFVVFNSAEFFFSKAESLSYIILFYNIYVILFKM